MNKKKTSERLAIDPVTLWRYQAVSAVLAREGTGQVRAEAVAAVSEQFQGELPGDKRRISRRSLYRWLKAYEQGGLEGLAPKSRKREGRALARSQIAWFKAQKEADPHVPIPELVGRARIKGVVEPDQRVSRTTVWRALRKAGVATTPRRRGKSAQARRFAYQHRMEMVLCDGKHFRAGPQRSKRVALFFLDDATRMVLSAVVGPSESTTLFLRGLHRCIFKYGIMQRLFLDNGSGFSSKDSHQVAAHLGIHLIHGTVGYPEGRGKVERFHRTIWQALLRYWDGNAEVTPTYQNLENRIDHYVREIYNRKPHQGLAGEVPGTRFQQDPLPLRFPKHFEDLSEKFVISYPRRVGKDHVVNLKGKAYEVPPGYGGSEILLDRHALTGQVTMLDQYRRITLLEVDPAGNARRPFPQTKQVEQPDGSDAAIGPSHAQLQFERDFEPLVDGQGNHFEDKEKNHE